MNLPQNIKSYLKQLPLKNMRGEEVFVSIVFFLSSGKKDFEVDIKNVKSNWSKTFINKKYNSAFAHRAQGYVSSCGKGRVCMTEEGIEYIHSLTKPELTGKTELVVFERGSTHSFDKFIRGILKSALKSVDIADTYVAGNIFDNFLDEISNKVHIRLIYGTDTGGFISRAIRFGKQYTFETKESKQFHDRFIIVDGKGYILGPSLKDAADKKPATLVVLSPTDSKKMVDMYSDLWS